MKFVPYMQTVARNGDCLGLLRKLNAKVEELKDDDKQNIANLTSNINQINLIFIISVLKFIK